jgi:hypothetical protein
MFLKEVVAKIKARVLCSVTFPENHDVYEITWKNMVQLGRRQKENIVLRMRFACWVTKVTDIHSECVISIAFPLQQ